MTGAEAIITCLRKALVFRGRAPRPEFWWFAIIHAVVVLGLFAIAGGWARGGEPGPPGGAGDIVVLLLPVWLAPITASPGLAAILVLVSVPLLSAGWRRLHDTGWPGWLMLAPTALGVLGRGAGIGMWVLMGDAAAPEGVTTGVAVVLMLLAMVAQFLAPASLLLLGFLLVRPSAPGANRHGPAPA